MITDRHCALQRDVLSRKLHNFSIGNANLFCYLYNFPVAKVSNAEQPKNQAWNAKPLIEILRSATPLKTGPVTKAVIAFLECT